MMIKEKSMAKEDLLFGDFPPVREITEDVKEKNTKRHTGSVRLAAGIYRTDEQDKQYRESSLKRKLP